MHEKADARTGHCNRAKRWHLALLWSAGMVLLALGAAVIVIGAYLVGASGRYPTSTYRLARGCPAPMI